MDNLGKKKENNTKQTTKYSKLKTGIGFFILIIYSS